MLNMEVSDVLMLQMVSRQWLRVIQGSPLLRRKIFLTSKLTGVYHPDLPQSALVASQRYSEAPKEGDSGRKASDFEINPLIVSHFSLQVPAAEEYLGCHICLLPFAAKNNPKMREPSASWRNMFLSQPPCDRVILSTISSESRYEVRELVENKHGITMGDVASKATEILDTRFDMCEGVWRMDWGINFKPGKRTTIQEGIHSRSRR